MKHKHGCDLKNCPGEDVCGTTRCLRAEVGLPPGDIACEDWLDVNCPDCIARQGSAPLPTEVSIEFAKEHPVEQLDRLRSIELVATRKSAGPYKGPHIEILANEGSGRLGGEGRPVLGYIEFRDVEAFEQAELALKMLENALAREI